MTLARYVVAFLSLAVCTNCANAHFIWVDVVNAENGPEARMYFSEEPAPGGAHLLAKVSHAKLYANGFQGGRVPLSLTESTDKESETGYLAATVGNAPVCVEVDVEYGVFERGGAPMLIHYYAKCVSFDSPSELESLKSPGKLRLDMIPRIKDGKAALLVLFDGRPAAGAEVVLLDDDAPQELRTDEHGLVSLKRPLSGRLAARAVVVDEDGSGEKDGRRYEETRHYCTLICNSANHSSVASATERPTATELLDAARANRAVWNGFPGFTCDVQIRVDHEEGAGRLKVNSDGVVEVTGIESIDLDWPEQQLNSLIMHRMPGVQVGDEAVFEEEPGEHVLGTSVRLKEERMGSVYRVRDHVIREVNRDIGPQRFTISVLNVVFNEEGKYLPHAYTVSFWNRQSGELTANHTHYVEWKRLGKYDLPKSLMIVSSKKGSSSVMRIDFNNVKLLGATEKVAAESK